MTTGEKITFLGILITFLTTLVGWIITYRAQHSVAKRQMQFQRELVEFNNKFDIEMEKIRQLAPGRLAELNRINQWIQNGLVLHKEAGYIQMYLARTAYNVDSKFNASTLVMRAVDWANGISEFGYFAEIYGKEIQPIQSNSDRTFSLPLRILLYVFRNEVIAFINQQLKAFFLSQPSGSQGAPGQVVVPDTFDWPSDSPKYPEKFGELCTALVAAIEGTKERIVA